MATALALGLLLAAAGPVDEGQAAPTFTLSWDRDLPILGTAAALAVGWGSELAWRQPTPCPCSTVSVPSFDRISLSEHSAASGTASDVLLVALLAAAPVAVIATAWPSGLRHTAELLAIEAESIALSTLATQLVKDAVARPYPTVYSTGDPSLSGYESFWSGHAAASFNAATTALVLLHDTAPDSVWPWVAGGLGLLAASSVAVLRVTAGDHFPSDVVVGALAGSAVGVAIPWLHQRRLPVTLVAGPAGAALVAHL
jgi:membrane-associated phospholipid phosphatase